MNRDQSFPARQWMRNVDARTSTPVPAAILAFVVGVVLMPT